MIGGYDAILESEVDPSEALQQAFLFAKQVWPNAVVEDANTGILLDPADPFTAFSNRIQIMIYSSAQALDSWNELGADPSNANTMVHVLVGGGGVTVVVDDPKHPSSKHIIQAMGAFLKNAPAACAS